MCVFVRACVCVWGKKEKIWHPLYSNVNEPVIVGASPYGIVTEVLLTCFLRSKVFQRVGPEEITHWPERRRLFESIQLLGAHRVQGSGFEMRREYRL